MATVNLAVAALADDAVEDNLGNVTINGSYPLMSAATYWFGLRFPSAAIAKGSTISAATLQMYVTAAHDEIHLDVYGQLLANPGGFSPGATSDISSRTRTVVKVDWDAASVGVGWQSKDVTSVVQEIVNLATWASGYALVLILDGQTGVDMSFWAFDVGSNYPKIDVTFTPPGVAGKAYSFRRRRV